MAAPISRVAVVILAAVLLAAAPARAAEPDPEAGREINQVCAACHGDFGQGGKKGEYPRIAGLHARYLAAQLHKFRNRQRINLPMVPYTEERELSDKDIRDVAAYLSAIRLATKPPDFKDSDDALTRLKAMDKVMKIPRAEGDVARGAELYGPRCASCHGVESQGKGAVFPMLAGQYTLYLRRQIEQFLVGSRVHDEERKDLLDGLTGDDIRDILAFLSSLER